MIMLNKTLANGFSLPVLGFGTWQLGGKMERDPQNDDAGDIDSIRAAINAGITHIDVAENYAHGHTEELVAEAIKSSRRSTLTLASKLSPDNQDKNSVRKSLVASLKRLHTDYLDLYLLHSPNYQIPVEETMAEMDKLMDEGLIRNIGVSNFSVKQMQRAQSATTYPIVANQVHYNLMDREMEHSGVLQYCQFHDIILIAYRPLQKGIVLEMGEQFLNPLREKYNKTSAQIALNWLIGQKNVVTIPRMRSLKHLEENLGSVGWCLDPEDMQMLRINFPNQKKISDVHPLREW